MEEPRHAWTTEGGTWEAFGSPRRVAAGTVKGRTGVKTGEARPEGVRLGPTSDESREQGGASGCGAGGAKGRDQRESGRPKHGPHAGTGSRVTGGRADTARHTEESQGEAHCASAAWHAGDDAGCLRRAEARGGTGRGRSEVEGVRGRAGRATARPARARACGNVAGDAVATGEDSEAGRRQATAGGGRTGGQDRPEGRCGQSPDADVGGGIPRVQLRVPARAGRARRAGRPGIRDREAQGQLDSGRRHRQVLGVVFILLTN